MQNENPTYSERYKAYVLLILTGVYAFNFIDRQILIILQESVKEDLNLSDTQLGLMTGLAFAFFYVTLGIPVARLADKTNRRNVIAVSLALWSLMTALSGMVMNFIQMLLARVGVGIGEAGGSPPAHSIISDYFPPEKRATALSIYSTGIYIGIFFGFFAGGWLDEHLGWRTAFLVVGLPGFLYALILLFSVKEPKRGLFDDQTKKAVSDASFLKTLKFLASKKTFVLLALAGGVHNFGQYGVGNFFAPFLARVHGMTSGEIGTWLGLSMGFGGIIGTFAGGWLADRLGKRDLRWYLWIPVVALIVNLPFLGMIIFSPDKIVVLIFFFFSVFLTSLYLGPSLAVTQNLADSESRALASAILFFMYNFIGLGFGPLTVGALSDYLTPQYGNESLRYAYCIMFFTGTIAAWLFYRASKFYEKEIL